VETYPLFDGENRWPFAFEIDNIAVSPDACARVLHDVPGVSDVEVPRRRFLEETRVTFRYHGLPFEVWEPYGDNSRYWIGPIDPKKSKIDVTPIENAFKQLSLPVSTVADLLAPLRRLMRKRR
jgi:hypothetical protein